MSNNASTYLGPLGIGLATAATVALVGLVTILPTGPASRGPAAGPGEAHSGHVHTARACPVTPDTAEQRLADGAGLSCGPRNDGNPGGPADRSRHCVGSADAAEFWIRHTGQLPGCPGYRPR